MGISGLLPALKAIQVTKHLSEYSGKTIAVDAYVWLHRGVYACATELATGKSTHKYVDYAMHRVRLLRHHGIEPYVVFDGGPLPAKKGTETERRQKREDSRARGKGFLAQGKHAQARECFIKCVDVTPQMAYQFIKALRAESVPYVVAPYEADAQLAYLERMGIVDAILTEDSDLLVFGCQTVLFKLDPVVSTVIAISRKDFGAVTASSTDTNGISLLGWSDVQFRAMTILSGCDYLPSIPGIGLKTACNLLRKWKTAKQVVRAIAMEGKKQVPPSYWKQFQLAEKCFLHQRVYCPKAEKLVHLTDVGDDWSEEFDAYVGSDLDAVLAKKIALGDADPATYLPMEDINQGFMPHALKPLATSNSPIKSLKAKGKMRESLPPSSKSRVGGIFNFFGPDAIIPPRPRQKTPVPVAKPNLTGKASGKRTLAEVMEQDIDRKKKPRHSHSPIRTTQSKFFASAGGVRRRHSDSAGAAEASGHCSQDKENISLLVQDLEETSELEMDGSDLSMRVNFDDEVDGIIQLDLDEFPDAVEQEDGYISPSPSYSKEADELSSPPQAGQSFSRGHVRARPRNQQWADAAVGAPPTGFLPSDEEDEEENSFGADIVSSPISVKRPTAHKTSMHALYTPTRVSGSRGIGNVLVEPTPTPTNKGGAYADIDEISSPTLYRGLDLRSMLDDDGLAEHELEEALLDAAGEPLASGFASSPSPSPETPDTDVRSQRDAVQAVTDIDDLEDEGEQVMREAADRAKVVMDGWRERWALPSGKNPNGVVPPRSSPMLGTKKELASGSRAMQLKRSETNVTPAGRHSLAKAPRSAPPKFNVMQGGSAGQTPASESKKNASKPRRSLMFETMQQTSTTTKLTKPTSTKKGRQVVDLTMSDALEDEILIMSPPTRKAKPSHCPREDSEEYDILAHAQLRLSQFRCSR